MQPSSPLRLSQDLINATQTPCPVTPQPDVQQEHRYFAQLDSFSCQHIYSNEMASHLGIAPHNVIIRQQVPPGALSGKLIAGKFTESSTIEYRPLGCTCRDWKSRGSIEMRALSESNTSEAELLLECKDSATPVSPSRPENSASAERSSNCTRALVQPRPGCWQNPKAWRSAF